MLKMYIFPQIGEMSQLIKDARSATWNVFLILCPGFWQVILRAEPVDVDNTCVGTYAIHQRTSASHFTLASIAFQNLIIIASQICIQVLGDLTFQIYSFYTLQYH